MARRSQPATKFPAAPRQQASATLPEALPPFPLDAPTWAHVQKTLALSPQQARLVELLLRGMQDKRIAAAMNLTVPTVRTYLKRIFDRLQVTRIS